jgi:hypothetical protein
MPSDRRGVTAFSSARAAPSSWCTRTMSGTARSLPRCSTGSLRSTCSTARRCRSTSTTQDKASLTYCAACPACSTAATKQPPQRSLVGCSEAVSGKRRASPPPHIRDAAGNSAAHYRLIRSPDKQLTTPWQGMRPGLIARTEGTPTGAAHVRRRVPRGRGQWPQCMATAYYVS